MLDLLISAQVLDSWDEHFPVETTERLIVDVAAQHEIKIFLVMEPYKFVHSFGSFGHDHEGFFS